MTTPYYTDERAVLHHGDCLDVLAAMPDASVDAIVTDPPYGLEFMGKEWDSFKSVPSGGAGNTRTGYTDGGNRLARPSFTGSPNPPCLNCGGTQRGAEGQGVKRCRCDSPAFPNVRAKQMRAFGEWCELWANQCLRVLKPGGMMLSFGGTRTWHRLACAAEDAGFEMRDSIAWLYGSGFPKSLDVGKAIDKRRTEDHEPIRVVCRAIRAAMDRRGLVSRELVSDFDGCHPRLVDHWAARDTDSQPALPTWRQWETLRGLFPELSALDSEAWRLNGRKGSPGDAWESAEVIGTARGIDTATSRLGFAGATYGGNSAAKDYDVKAPATPDAERWQGWGTALKPAFEPIVVARKPLAGTVAANILAHGTGALNIDGCRVEPRPGDYDHPGNDNRTPRGNIYGAATHSGRQVEPHPAGRWPANVVLDESQAAALDEQSGTLTSGANPTRRGSDKFRDAYGDFKGQAECTPARGADTGGASRFFYTTKAPSAERPKANGIAHPTVKPLDLMRWLVRLVTPPGGVVLDPFAGSGTTLEAAIVEGFRCIGIEREADYLPLIEQRIARACPPLDFTEETA